MALELVIATIALSIGSFMNVLDSTIVNVSLSHIAGDFAVAPSQGTWVITSYGVSEAIFLPLIGYLTKRFGVVRQYVWSTVLFTVASLLCGLAFNFEFLLFARILQGIVGASMIPLSQTLLLSLYPKEKKSFALGVWSLTVIVAPILGPILGGYITDAASWRWCFYVNLPFGVISSYVVYKIFKKRQYKEVLEKEALDYVGLALLVLGIGTLQIMLDKGNDLDWFSSTTIVALTVIAFISIVTLIIWEWYHPKPIVNVRLFLNQNFKIGSLMLMLAMIIYFMGVIIVPLWLQNFMGYPAFKSGLATATSGLAVMIIAPILSINLHKFDMRKVIATGFIAYAVSTLFIAKFSTDTTMGYVALSRFLSGVSLGIFFLPLNALTLSDISDEDLPAASGIYNFMRNLGSSISTSLGVNFWMNGMALHHENLVTNVTLSNNNFQNYLTSIPLDLNTKLGVLEGIIYKQTAVLSMNDVLIKSAILLAVVSPIIFLAKRPAKVVKDIE